jgi:hypothetical protein
LIAATLALYEPWRGLPFDIIDFSEFLPLLHRATFFGRLHAFLTYYASQGRFNALSYLGLVTKWSMFGTHTAGWQLARFAQMWLIIYLAYRVLRRFGSSAWGAAAGAALFTVATPAIPAWLRLTMGEPLGSVFLLGALLLATRYRASNTRKQTGITIVILIALGLLAKEMLVAFVPFIVIIACCQATPGRLERPHIDRRNTWLVSLVVLATLAVLIPVALIAHTAPRGNFASQYSGWQTDIGQLAINFASVALPVTESRPGEPMSLFTAPANACYLLLLAVAIFVFWRDSTKDRTAWYQAIAWTLVALSLPLIVVAAYGPWSIFQDFYGLPYLIGPAILLARAVTSVTHLHPRLTVPMRALCVGILVFAGVRAELPAQESMARRQVQGDVAAYLAGHAGGVPVLVMASDFQATTWARWQDTGPTLGRYAHALYPEAGLIPFRDTTCTVPPRPYVVDGRRGTVVTYASDCGAYSGPTATFRADYRSLSIHPPAIKRNTIRIDICDSTCTR